LRDRLETRQRYAIERAQLDLDDEPPPPLEIEDLRKKYEAKFRHETGYHGAQRSDASGPIDARPSAYHEDEHRLAVLVRPTELASNLDFARRVVADVESVLARAPPPSGIEVELAGRYKKRVDLQALLARDLALTSVLAVLLVLGYVALHFRRVLAVVLVMAPLALGLLVSYGVAGFGFGTLNILTGFVGAILLGIGIDNGIHLLGRYLEARRAGAGP
jgi:predicted RND superfamily exporter protein